MGWCHEFGVTVREGCGHPMRAGEAACECPQCGIVCEGQFNGCATVWAAGPREVVLVRPEWRAEVTAEEQLLAQEQVVAEMHAPVEEQVVAEVHLPVEEQVVGEVQLVAPVLHGLTRETHTAWPLTETQARIWLESSAARADERVETMVEVSAAGAAPPVPAADERRSQIFEWLQQSFEGLNSQMRVLSDNLSRQQQALAEVSASHEEAGRLSQLADALPERIGTAVQEAVTAGRRSLAAEAAYVAGLDRDTEPADVEPADVEPVDVEPVDVEQADVEPVQDDEPELSQPAVAVGQRAVEAERDWRTAVEDVMVDLREPNAAPEPVGVYADAPSDDQDGDAVQGLRTQLTGLASTVQGRINRSGWQEKLRSLSTR